MKQFRALDRPAQVLLLNMLINNIGFSMLIPYLATHMSADLGLAAWLVGLILGVRNLSQQGLFLIGGSLSDRIMNRFGDTPLGMVESALDRHPAVRRRVPEEHVAPARHRRAPAAHQGTSGCRGRRRCVRANSLCRAGIRVDR